MNVPKPSILTWNPIETAPKDGTRIFGYPAWGDGGEGLRAGEIFWSTADFDEGEWVAFHLYDEDCDNVIGGMSLFCEPEFWAEIPTNILSNLP